MTADARSFLPGWHRIVAERDLDALFEVLADDVTMATPPYWDRLAGRDLVHHLLGIIIETIEGFTYHREWVEAGELALEFRGRVGDCELQGIDLISLDESGRIRALDVMVRPANALAALRERVAPRMQAFLAERAAAGPEG